MKHMTTLDELKQHITVLASAEEPGTPFISVYLNLEDKTTGWPTETPCGSSGTVQSGDVTGRRRLFIAHPLRHKIR
jgi:hypothetical protein